MTVEWNSSGTDLLIEGHVVAKAWQDHNGFCFQIMKTNLTSSYTEKGFPSLIKAKSALIKNLSNQLKHPIYPKES
jgi:hypothetical protein